MAKNQNLINNSNVRVYPEGGRCLVFNGERQRRDCQKQRALDGIHFVNVGANEVQKDSGIKRTTFMVAVYNEDGEHIGHSSEFKKEEYVDSHKNLTLVCYFGNRQIATKNPAYKYGPFDPPQEGQISFNEESVIYKRQRKKKKIGLRK